MSSAGPTTWALTVAGKEGGELVLGGEEGVLRGGTYVLASWPSVSPEVFVAVVGLELALGELTAPWSWLLPENVTSGNRSGALL